MGVSYLVLAFGVSMLLRVAQGAYNITEAHLADAIELLTARTRPSLSENRGVKKGYE